MQKRGPPARHAAAKHETNYRRSPGARRPFTERLAGDLASGGARNTDDSSGPPGNVNNNKSRGQFVTSCPAVKILGISEISEVRRVNGLFLLLSRFECECISRFSTTHIHRYKCNGLMFDLPDDQLFNRKWKNLWDLTKGKVIFFFRSGSSYCR